MAQVRILEDKPSGELMDYMHRCGELVVVETMPTHLICFRDAWLNRITECSHCGKKLEWQDVIPVYLFEMMRFMYD